MYPLLNRRGYILLNGSLNYRAYPIMLSRRIIFLGILFILLASGSKSQITSWSGEFKYDHLYQDVVSNGILSTSLRRNPMVDLNAVGNVFNPQLGTFYFRTSLNLNYTTNHARDYSLNNHQLLWDYYDARLILLPEYFLKFDLGAREGLINSQTDFGKNQNFFVDSKRQEEHATISTNNIDFLPATILSYQKTREWSYDQTPYDRENKVYSLAISTSNGGTTMNLGGSISDYSEKFTGQQDRYYTLHFIGTKEFTQNQQLEFGSDYDRYDEYTTTTGLISYSGNLEDQVSLYSSLDARNSSSSGFSTTDITGTEGVHVNANQYFAYSLNATERTGNTSAIVSGNATKAIYDVWGTTVGVSHNRPMDFGSISNTLTLGIGEQNYGERRTSLSTSFFNSAQTKIGGFGISANQGFVINSLRDGYKRDDMTNTFRLAATGTIFSRIRSFTSGDFRAQTYYGNIGALMNSTTYQFRQTFNTSFYYYIPLTVEAGGNLAWYFFMNKDRSYSWNIAIGSNNFFLQNLSARYNYNRSFDQYYTQETIDQSIELQYRWRSLSFEVSGRENVFIDTRREFRFTVTRPF